jgi:hydroxymethylpyrimidine pyrophosphatase-like HAD family hydrolase
MNLPFKLISTDFDGTLFSDYAHPPVPKRLQELLGKLQLHGVKWMINTGRDMTGLLEVMARSHMAIRPDFLGCVERELYVHEGNLYKPLGDWNASCARAQAEVFAIVQQDVPRLFDWVKNRYSATVYEDPYSPFCLVAENNKDADVIVAYLEEYCRTIPNLSVVRNDVYARLSHGDFNKGTVLSEVARTLQIPTEQVVAAGDHLNDLPMLKRQHARWLLAPANAVDEVKMAILSQDGYLSDHVCGMGILDGLRHLLEQAGVKVSEL